MKKDEKEIAILWRKFMRRRTAKNRNALMEHYIPLVEHHANRVLYRLPKHIELDDLISVGMLGLMDAIQHFDLKKKIPFDIFSQWRIRGAMLDEIRHMDWVPRLTRKKAKDLSEKEQKEFNDSTQIRSINAVIKKHNGKKLEVSDFIEDKNIKPVYSNLQESDFLKLITRGLSKKERLIIISYYYQWNTMKETGKQINFSESRVSQLHTLIMQMLRKNHMQERLENEIIES